MEKNYIHTNLVELLLKILKIEIFSLRKFSFQKKLAPLNSKNLNFMSLQKRLIGIGAPCGSGSLCKKALLDIKNKYYKSYQ